MKVNNKTLKSWFSLPEIGFGTWTMGWKMEREENYNEVKDIEAIRYAIDNWMTHFDTAELYAEGYSEEILWKAIAWYDRSEFIIASKVRGTKCRYDDVISSCDESLMRMWITSFDLFYIHWRDNSIDLKETMRALDDLLETGKIKNIAVCNFSVESLKEAQSYTKNKIVANQVHYNLVYRELEHSNLLDYCQNNDIMIVAWRPLEYWNLIESNNSYLWEFTEKYSKTNSQIALNWLISQNNVVTIFKSINPEHIDENLWVTWWNLENNDIENIRNNYPWQEKISNAVVLS